MPKPLTPTEFHQLLEQQQGKLLDTAFERIYSEFYCLYQAMLEANDPSTNEESPDD